MATANLGPGPDVFSTFSNATQDVIKVLATNTGPDTVFFFENTGFDKIDLTDIPSITSPLSQIVITANGSDVDLTFPQVNGSTVTISGITASELQNLASQIFILAGSGVPSAPQPLGAEVFVVSSNATNYTDSGTTVAQATTTGTNLSYSISQVLANGTGGNVGGLFNINSSTGAISLATAGTNLTANFYDIQVTANSGGGTASPVGTIRVYTSLQNAIADTRIGNGTNDSADATGRETIKVAEGNYGSITLYEKSPSDQDVNKRIHIAGPYAGIQATGTRTAGTEAVVDRITLFSSTSLPGIRDGYDIDGLLVSGGRVDLYDLGLSGSERDNMRFRNNIFRGNTSSDPTIQIETPSGGATSDNIIIERNFFDGIAPRVSLAQGAPQAIKLNNVNTATIQNNRIIDYPGAQGFGVLTQYGTSGISVLNNQLSNIGIAAIAGPGISGSGNTLNGASIPGF